MVPKPNVQSAARHAGALDGSKQQGKASGKQEKKPKARLAHAIAKPYMQNRELSWLTFNKRVADQSVDPNVPLLERMKFIAIWRSNLQEFFMVRVGSLLDLELAKELVHDSKTGMTPAEQLDAVYARVQDLTPQVSEDFRAVRHQMEDAGIHQLYPDELTAEQHEQLMTYLDSNVLPLVSPQIVNALHPFPHLENGALYIAVRLDDLPEEAGKGASKGERKAARVKAAENVVMGIIPMPRNCSRCIQLDGPDDDYYFILIEHALEMVADKIFSMYPVKHANVIQVTRNADLDTYEESDEYDEDFRSHMQRILKKRARLAPVRLESERPLSDATELFLRKKLGLARKQIFCVGLPLDMGYAFGLPGMVGAQRAAGLVDEPASPQWPASLMRGQSVIEQVQRKDIMLSYPYETMDAFVHLLQEAAADPDVISIKITLYRLASQSRLAEALIAAAEAGKEVTALFELRARFDENNNIEWSQRFEEAGCNIIYGFRDFKVHSKICAITRRTPDGLQFITQLGTGNYNEKTAKLYTDLSMITADPAIGRDAAVFFRNMQLEAVSDDYRDLWVAPLMIKPRLCEAVDEQIARAREGKPAEVFMKTNSVTDKDIIEKLVEASQAGVKVTMLVRGISCLVPGVKGYTENVRVVSVVGRLLEHSRVYVFGTQEECCVYLSSADLMTRNLDKRVEIAWPVLDPDLKEQVVDYFRTMLADTAKLRELLPDGSYTDLCCLVSEGAKPFDAQDHLIKKAYIAAERAPRQAGPNYMMHAQLSTQVQALVEEAEEDRLAFERTPDRRARAIDAETEAEPVRYEGKNDAEEAKTAGEADVQGGEGEAAMPQEAAVAGGVVAAEEAVAAESGAAAEEAAANEAEVEAAESSAPAAEPGTAAGIEPDTEEAFFAEAGPQEKSDPADLDGPVKIIAGSNELASAPARKKGFFAWLFRR